MGVFVSTFSFTLIMAISSVALAETTRALEPESFTLCRLNNIARSIRVEREDEQCFTLYTRAGVDRVVGRGRHSASCEGILDNIRGNLEAAAWDCRDVQHARVWLPESEAERPREIQ